MNTDILLPAAIVSAAMGVTALGLLQTDFVSRQMLNPTGLQIKRKQEYAYRWQTALEKMHLQQSYYLAGGISQVHEDADYLAKQTEYLSQPQELETLLQRILKPNKEEDTRVQILKLDTDPHDTTGEYYLYLLERAVDQQSKLPRMIQVPLTTFGLMLHKAFDEQLTSTTLCFVADASSGKATNLLEQLVQESKTGVAVLSEPLWMATFGKLVDQHLIATNKMEKILFGLCRLQAWSVRDLTKISKTVMITLPGQATTPILLPLLQTVFPEDRHVFAYDGCVVSVQRGIAARRNIVTRRGQLANHLSEVVSMTNDPIRHTTPFCQTSLTKAMHGLKEALALVPVDQAEVVESWMTSVHAFLALKEKDNTNGYLPYVFKLSQISGGKQPHSFDSDSDSYWSLCSLLQYITGCRSRPLPEGTIDAAAEWLKDYNHHMEKEEQKFRNVSETQRMNMENCVFQHKSILIGNKTLQDTVLPRQHWTLKQAAKNGGCACCGPDPFEDEEEEENDRSGMVEKNNGMDMMFVPGTSSSSSKPGGGYVDGKMGFAFDPSKFS